MTNSEILQDFRRRYEGTFVWLSMEDITKETLVKVTRVEDDAEKVGVLRLDSIEYGSLSINMGSSGHSLKFKYPPVGVFQHDVDALAFTRRPARQYRRGLCADNSTLRNVTASVVSNRARFTPREVASAFEHKTFSTNEALRLLRMGRVRSVALADNFAISLSITGTSDYIVYHWINPVARCTREGKLTQIMEDIYKPQLRQLFEGN